MSISLFPQIVAFKTKNKNWLAAENEGLEPELFFFFFFPPDAKTFILKRYFYVETSLCSL